MSDATSERYKGREVVGSDGGGIGKIVDIYVDDDTGTPAWVAIHMGRLRSKTAFAPLRGATDDGERIVLAVDRDTVRDAPGVDDGEDGYLSPEQEDALERHYASALSAQGGGGGGEGSSEPEPPADDPEPEPEPVGEEEPEPERAADADEPDDEPADGDGGEVMTRSEEQLQVGTERVERERVRLRKYVVTEQVTQTVPVSHEEVRIEREPIDPDAAGAAEGELGEDEHEVVLYEERPVVTKETVPVERVRLSTETVEGEAEVHEDLRKERIDTE